MRLAAPAAVFVAAAVCAVAACTNGGGLGSVGNGGGGGGSPSPLPSAAIGVGIPTGKIGVEDDPVWGTISGYTQSQTSQILAFAPGAKITIQNLSSIVAAHAQRHRPGKKTSRELAQESKPFVLSQRKRRLGNQTMRAAR